MKIKDSITVTKIRKSEISLFGFFLLLFPIALNIRTVFIQQEIIDAGASLMMIIRLKKSPVSIREPIFAWSGIA